MAHDAHITGRVSELKAITALIANGYEVAEPVVAESYDLLVRKNGETARVQVKTCRTREDRDAVIVHAKRNNGEPYTVKDCDYLVGVLDDEVYMFECRGVSEYWVRQDQIGWKRLQ